jgi:hypothetical protein
VLHRPPVAVVVLEEQALLEPLRLQPRAEFWILEQQSEPASPRKPARRRAPPHLSCRA